MYSFLTGFGAVLGVITALAVGAELSSRQLTNWWRTDQDIGMMVVALFLMPLAMGWITLDLVHRIRPRAWLDHRARRRCRLALLGVSAGCGSMLALTAALLWLEPYAPTSVIAGFLAVGSTAVAALVMPRARPGCCVRCGYDVSGLAARCPECGSLDPC